jgi:hypothetical protein
MCYVIFYTLEVPAKAKYVYVGGRSGCEDLGA